jgi:hypothetical protein
MQRTVFASVVPLSSISLLSLTTAAQVSQKLPTLTPFTTVIPASNRSLDDVTAAANAGTGLQVWTKTLSATKHGLSYTVTMVGNDPSTSTVTTNIPAVIIPVIIKIATTTFNKKHVRRLKCQEIS